MAEGSMDWLLSDRLASIRDVVDNSGNVLDAIDYDAFGNTANQIAPAEQPAVGFAGYQFDVAAGFYRARCTELRSGRSPVGFARSSRLWRGRQQPLSLCRQCAAERYNDPSGQAADFLDALLSISMAGSLEGETTGCSWADPVAQMHAHGMMPTAVAPFGPSVTNTVNNAPRAVQGSWFRPSTDVWRSADRGLL